MITAIGDVMRECYKRGWITTRDGNCSVRKTGDNKIYITPSGARKNLIYPEFIERLKISPAPDFYLSVDREENPSGELEMHWLLLKEASTTRCVLHVHSTNIVAAMFAGWSLPDAAAAFPEVYRYTRVGPNVPSLPAISQELADATAAAFEIENGVVQFDVVGQANHGVCAVGKSPWDAFEHIERLEHICQIVLNSGIKPN
ncbi:MAG TPA: class II aldolase/adducin family protein [Flavobacteriales bacterium]|nr:class II aldolase/adducin family protein [Flavobacteriales bacterium]